MAPDGLTMVCAKIIGHLSDSVLSISYIDGLSATKQDKALIDSQMAQDIKEVLSAPKGTIVGSAQFRYVSNLPY